MNHASLFSGIGGFDLAAEWMGWNNIFQVEKDEWCRSILSKHFPNTKRYEDIKDFNGKEYKGSIDIISGGFPCQPFSVAGKQKGKNDDRYLWPEMLRVISEIRPTWVIGENVPGIISLALDQVYVDLENEGYTVQAFIIPACSVNAIHRRDRVWILAYSSSNDGHRRTIKNATKSKGERIRQPDKIQFSGESDQLPSCLHAHSTIPRSQRGTGTSQTWEHGSTCHGRTKLWFPVSQPTICRGNDGVSYRLDDGRLISPKQRTNSLKGLGNAVVPQVVYQIFKIVNLYSANNENAQGMKTA